MQSALHLYTTSVLSLQCNYMSGTALGFSFFVEYDWQRQRGMDVLLSCFSWAQTMILHHIRTKPRVVWWGSEKCVCVCDVGELYASRSNRGKKRVQTFHQAEGQTTMQARSPPLLLGRGHETRQTLQRAGPTSWGG